ncbi:hypothetical protein B0T25DRAFT_627802 [Lasiosphaeria hispida]|uniref:Protein kinase domain-containing protein n=1 Tax=Lasiosphaeria hispida TaxID=260671 RepID=A0AAJ0HVM5_9PEZI|nr:hypothetical protein B0T25DRAFT_627802 [Lasiosphaeria hispida]
MIPPACRFAPAVAPVVVEDETRRLWFDYDSRRAFVVRVLLKAEDADGDDTDLKSFQKKGKVAGEWFQKHPDELGLGITGIELSEDAELLSKSYDPALISAAGQQLFPLYPTLAEAQLPGHAKTILRSELVELDRLWRNVDLVSFTNESGETERAAFKYYTEMARGQSHLGEHKLLLHLPPHPNLLRYTRTVLDENSGRVVGLCTEYFPGRDLTTAPIIFKLSWLEQLMRLVDELNLTAGIAHSDIRPANLMVDETTDTFKLLDFGHSRHIGGLSDNMEAGRPQLVDVQAVVVAVYTIITQQKSLSTGVDECNERAIQSFEAEIPSWDWRQHKDTKLDHPVSEYQRVLSDWVATRQKMADAKHTCTGCDNSGSEDGQNPWAATWERPATKHLVPGVVMLANGKPADGVPQAGTPTVESPLRDVGRGSV